MEAYVFIFAAAIFSGALLACFLIYSKPKFWGNFFALFPLGMGTGVLLQFRKIFPESGTEILLFIAGLFLLVWLLAFFVTLKILIHRHQKDRGLTLYDLLSGRDKDILDLLSDKEQVRLEKQQLEIDRQEMEAERVNLGHEKEHLKSQNDGLLTLDITGNQTTLVSTEHLKTSPSVVREMCKLNAQLALLLSQSKENHKNELTQKLTDSQKAEYIYKVFQTTFKYISRYIIKHIFKESDLVRCHFRAMAPSNEYHSICAYQGNGSYKKQINMVKYDSLIRESYEQGSALLYSQNKPFAQRPKHNRFPEFITYSFKEVEHKDMPIFSLGISFEDATTHYPTIQIILHYKFEKLLQTFINSLYYELQIDKATLANIVKLNKATTR